MLVSSQEQCQTAGMRFLAGLRLVLVAAALIGLLAGPSVVAPLAAMHAGMAMSTIAEASHDCCGKTAPSPPTGKADLAGACFGPGCSTAIPALLPVAPAMLFAAERPADATITVAGLDGRSLRPPLEPPRA